ncbi:MAG: biosynthetic arginine decarboxylase [Magnetococcales bacterium]|nr:biosynthetic arginine decarboxylase [Magnetococcales bacterium]MBF0321436.1 biosynthetic arginine decarboxylase [Magnetococcales bacterium]
MKKKGQPARLFSPPELNRAWTIADSLELYNVPGWGIGFFGANEQGHLTVSPLLDQGPALDLLKLTENIQNRGTSLPVLIRFSDILRVRIQTLQACFQKAREEYAYRGRYIGAYPIKVNQQRQVVEELVAFGHDIDMGLEAGSRPELQIVLALLDNPDAPIICNGYKDDEFIHLALMGQQMGRNIHVVIEKPQELNKLLLIAKELNIRPNIGLRIKLEASSIGKWWETSGGLSSKFGLTAMEILDAVEIIQAQDMLDCVRLLHFHIGTQISNIRKFKNALRETTHFYAELRRLGCQVQYVDIGGGLGVDYDGSQTTKDSSVNYSIQEYANDVVAYLQEVCEIKNLPHPDIISESGRALTAHHAMLVFNVLEVASSVPFDRPVTHSLNDAPEILELAKMLEDLNEKNALEVWHDTLQLKEDFQKMFTLGALDLVQRSKGERLVRQIAFRIDELARKMAKPSSDLSTTTEYLLDKYYCNFSLFQSLPDHWAIDQLFPVVPLQRLDERPSRLGTLQDITCDSDGSMDHFIHREGGAKRFLELHPLKKGEPYLLGVFLTGAYQEILGDMHNLFGDTDVVHVSVATTEQGWEFRQVLAGELVRDVLKHVSYDPEELVRRVGHLTRKAVSERKANPEQARAFVRAYAASLNDYTYLETS